MPRPSRYPYLGKRKPVQVAEVLSPAVKYLHEIADQEARSSDSDGSITVGDKVFNLKDSLNDSSITELQTQFQQQQQQNELATTEVDTESKSKQFYYITELESRDSEEAAESEESSSITELTSNDSEPISETANELQENSIDDAEEYETIDEAGIYIDESESLTWRDISDGDWLIKRSVLDKWKSCQNLDKSDFKDFLEDEFYKRTLESCLLIRAERVNSNAITAYAATQTDGGLTFIKEEFCKVNLDPEMLVVVDEGGAYLPTKYKLVPNGLHHPIMDNALEQYLQEESNAKELVSLDLLAQGYYHKIKNPTSGYTLEYHEYDSELEEYAFFEVLDDGTLGSEKACPLDVLKDWEIVEYNSAAVNQASK